jgi:hypothetical protein
VYDGVWWCMVVHDVCRVVYDVYMVVYGVCVCRRVYVCMCVHLPYTLLMYGRAWANLRVRLKTISYLQHLHTQHLPTQHQLLITSV